MRAVSYRAHVPAIIGAVNIPKNYCLKKHFGHDEDSSSTRTGDNSLTLQNGGESWKSGVGRRGSASQDSWHPFHDHSFKLCRLWRGKMVLGVITKSPPWHATSSLWD